MKKLSNEQYIIEYNIENYEKDKTNINEVFNHSYFMDAFDEGEDYGIIIKIYSINKNSNQKASYLIGDDCAAVTDEKRVIIHDKYLYILLHFGDVIKINLDTGKIEKQIELEQWGTYYNIYSVNDRMIIYGELILFSLDYDLNIIGRFDAEDVIVDFQLKDNFITIKDFNENIYTLDMDLNK